MLAFEVILIQIAGIEAEKSRVFNVGSFFWCMTDLAIVVNFVDFILTHRIFILQIEYDLKDRQSSVLTLRTLILIVHICVGLSVIAAWTVCNTKISHILRLESHQESPNAKLGLIWHVSG